MRRIVNDVFADLERRRQFQRTDIGAQFRAVGGRCGVGCGGDRCGVICTEISVGVVFGFAGGFCGCIAYRFHLCGLPALQIGIAFGVGDQHVHGAIHRRTVLVFLGLPGRKIQRYQRIGRPVHKARGQAVVLGDGQFFPRRLWPVLHVGQQVITEGFQHLGLFVLALGQR